MRRVLRAVLVPLLAVVVALLIGAILLYVSDIDPLKAYRALYQGAFGNIRAWKRTFEKATPLIFSGLAVAFAFRAGLFNIGAQGQLLLGAITSAVVGYAVEGLPPYIHIPLALMAGALVGALYGAFPGILKVYTGAHEVITTIMLNYVASLFAGWTVYAGGSQGQTPGPLWDPTAGPISETPDVLPSAQIPWIFGPPYRVHWGIVLVLAVVVLIWWLLYRTTIGFEIRTVGQNLKASKYAGIRVNWTIVLTMILAGGLAGLAGGIETLGVNHKFAPEFSGSVGFDGITIALLGQTHPFGVVLAALLFGALDAGGAKMQFDSGVAADIIQVIQALILAFVAAPAIVRSIFRLKRTPEQVKPTVSTSWSGPG